MKKCREIWSFCLAVLMIFGMAAMPVSAMSASIEMITEPIYGSIGKFSDGVAIVRDFETRLYGVIDENGNVVHAMKYERIEPFYQGVAFAAYRDAAGNYAEWRHCGNRYKTECGCGTRAPIHVLGRLDASTSSKDPRNTVHSK